MVKVLCIELTLNKEPKYKDGELIELTNGKMGYIMEAVVYVPELFGWMPVQDDTISLVLAEDITVFLYRVELLNGQEITVNHNNILRIVEEKETDTEFLRTRIKELEAEVQRLK